MNLRLLVRSSLLLLLAIGVLTGGIAAQETPASGTFTGVVDVFNASVLVSSGVVFDISGVQVDEHFTLRTGIPVEVSFTVSRGILTATGLTNPSGATPGHGTLRGAVDLASESTFVINGLSFDVSGVKIEDDSLFKTGAWVEVAFDVTGGAFTITDIEPYDDQSGVIIGRVELLEIPRMEIGAIPFDIASAEVDEDPYALEPAALVKVEFRVPPASIAQASSVDVREPALAAGQEDDFKRVILAGTVTARDDDSITIAGVEVALDPSVRVDTDVRVGEPARVTFRPDVTTQEIRPTRVKGIDDIDDVDDVLDDRGDDDLDDDDSDVDSPEDDDKRDDSDEDDDDDDSACSEPDDWTAYHVRSGDTLSRIASAAGVTVQAIMEANCLSSANLIHTGQTLFVPRDIGGSSDDDSSDDDGGDDSSGGSSDDGGSGGDDGGSSDDGGSGGDDEGDDGDD